MSVEIPDIPRLMAAARKEISEPLFAARVAIVADTASQILAKATVGYAHTESIQLDLFEADFGQQDLLLLNPNSELYEFGPTCVFLFLASEKLAITFAQAAPEDRRQLAEKFLSKIKAYHDVLANKGVELIAFNLAFPGDGICGNFASQHPGSLTHCIREINFRLAEMASSVNGMRIFDLEQLQSQLGRSMVFDPKLYYTSKIAITPEATRFVARDLVKMVSAKHGRTAKLVIADLDNTLWGGVIGDDGMARIEIGELGLGAAFSKMQLFLKELKERGIALAVCSKNDEVNAKEPFEKHPDMALSLNDISVFMANWNDKASNIRKIKDVINVDFSAMVFLDDNPVERDLVRSSFPTMVVPELPQDPSEYVSFLQGLNLFETASVTEADANRTKSYQAEFQRQSEKEQFVSEDDFLSSLEMRGCVDVVNEFQVPRAAQLTQRSNQFNLRTVRYSESEIETLRASDDAVPLAVTLEDRFGDYGLISVVILRRTETNQWFIDTWLMSCRVLGRGVERFVLNEIVAWATGHGCRTITAEYIPTAKNSMVAEHYTKLGFQEVAPKQYALEVDSYAPVTTAINTTVA